MLWSAVRRPTVRLCVGSSASTPTWSDTVGWSGSINHTECRLMGSLCPSVMSSVFYDQAHHPGCGGFGFQLQVPGCQQRTSLTSYLCKFLKSNDVPAPTVWLGYCMSAWVQWLMPEGSSCKDKCLCPMATCKLAARTLATHTLGVRIFATNYLCSTCKGEFYTF